MNQKKERVTLNIDNRVVVVERGKTILQAAEQNDIYIPTLCAHEDLTPFGGCRMCLVEVEGARSFLTACTTPVEDGMIVRTHTDQIQKERKEILELILSEHTSSCLICEEREECKESMNTIRKVGVTTGCRMCPNEDSCELEEVVKKFDMQEFNLPVYYRNLPVEKNDPFYDRDYNLCILCGRCVRICQEVRNANVLAFSQRGRYTVIGPAFNRTHIEAGCEFCGACVSVCPTGSLAEKSNKWDGVPEKEEVTTCSLCGVGCQMRVLIKNGKVVGTLPADDKLVNNGQLCVKGRFCVNELVNSYERLKDPVKIINKIKQKITFNEAISIVAEKLSNCPSKEFGAIVSSNCTNEDLYIAQKFTRVVMGSNNIDTTDRLFYGSGFNAYLNLMKKSVPISKLRDSSVIFCIGLDMRFGRSVVGVQLRKAVLKGVKIITLYPGHHSLSLCADVWLQPAPGEEAVFLDAMVKITRGKSHTEKVPEEVLSAAQLLKQASDPVILIGSDFLYYNNAPSLLKNIEKLAKNVGAGVLPLPAQNNLYGSLVMGALPELLPGGYPLGKDEQREKLKKVWKQDLPVFKSDWDVSKSFAGRRLKVAYFIGETPRDSKLAADFLIYQNHYPMDESNEADIILPAATFTEVDGTFINCEGRIQRVRKAADHTGMALPDWKILCKIAQKMGAKGFNFSNVSEIHKEMACFVKGFRDIDNKGRSANPLPPDVSVKKTSVSRSIDKDISRAFPFIFTTSFYEHVYRGLPITDKVEGLKKLVAEEALIMNPEDARKLGIVQGDEVIVTSTQFEKSWPAWISVDQEPGTVHVTQLGFKPNESNPDVVKIRRKDV